MSMKIQTPLVIAVLLGFCSPMCMAEPSLEVEIKPVLELVKAAGDASAPETPAIDLGAPAVISNTTESESSVVQGRASGASDTVSGGDQSKPQVARLKKFNIVGAQVTSTNPTGSISANSQHQVERVQFNRRPITVALGINRERLIVLPGPAVFHVPDGIDRQVHLQILDRTVYATALAPFSAIRVVAEVIATGVQIPLNLIANKSTIAASEEIEIFASPEATHVQSVDDKVVATGDSSPNKDPVEVDMVQLTRYAARMLYGPRRLAPNTDRVQQVSIEHVPLDDLIRGAKVNATPVGQWRAGNLYVAAVRVSNLEKFPLVLQLEGVRGTWLAATAQHGRLGSAGTDTDTTALYLVCNRPFNACR